MRSHSVAWFLGALVALIVTTPFLEGAKRWRFIEPTILTAVLLSAVLAVGGRHRTLSLACILVAPVLVARWLSHLEIHSLFYPIFVLSFLIFLGFIVFQFLRFIMRSPRVNSEVLCAAIAAYLLLALLWGAAYALVARLDPGSFAGVAPESQPLHGFDSVYFSIITLTTIGYGDISPASGPARMLAMLEAVTGTMYMAVMVARLVAAYSSEAIEEEVKTK
jgi:hypothetical protein